MPRGSGFGNSFDNDQHHGERFDYLLANPPFGVEWKMVADTIRGEHKTRGFVGRFGAGLPRINDGSFLFLQHMISKMKRPDEGGARLAIVFNGSPLFTGAAGSGESEIRRWIIENDWLEAVVALPDQLFYNTGISTYFWVVTNRKSPEAAWQGAAHRRPASRGPRCAGALATNESRSARTRSLNSPASMARLRKAHGSRFFQTRASASCASPSSGPSNSDGRSPTTLSPRSLLTGRSASCQFSFAISSLTSSKRTTAMPTRPRRL